MPRVASTSHRWRRVEVRVEMTCLVIGVLKSNIVLAHGLGDDLEGLDNVTEDDGLPLELLVLAKALGVDELHLLEDG